MATRICLLSGFSSVGKNGVNHRISDSEEAWVFEDIEVNQRGAGAVHRELYCQMWADNSENSCAVFDRGRGVRRHMHNGRGEQ